MPVVFAFHFGSSQSSQNVFIYMHFIIPSFENFVIVWFLTSLILILNVLNLEVKSSLRLFLRIQWLTIQATSWPNFRVLIMITCSLCTASCTLSSRIFWGGHLCFTNNIIVFKAMSLFLECVKNYLSWLVHRLFAVYIMFVNCWTSFAFYWSCRQISRRLAVGFKLRI